MKDTGVGYTVITHDDSATDYHTLENFGREKLVNLENGEPFAKVFLTNIHRYTENVYGISTDCCLFAKFFLANSFYLHGLPTKYFPCMVVNLESQVPRPVCLVYHAS